MFNCFVTFYLLCLFVSWPHSHTHTHTAWVLCEPLNHLDVTIGKMSLPPPCSRGLKYSRCFRRVLNAFAGKQISLLWGCNWVWLMWWLSFRHPTSLVSQASNSPWQNHATESRMNFSSCKLSITGNVLKILRWSHNVLRQSRSMSVCSTSAACIGRLAKKKMSSVLSKRDASATAC